MILTRPKADTPEIIQDKAQVKELIEFERFCRDNALWEEMIQCYEEDSFVNISWFQGSGREFVDASGKMKGRAPHKIFDTHIWINGDKAVAIMLASIQKRTDIDGFLMDLNSDTKLIFKVQRINNLWYIVSLDSIYEKDSLVPVVPNSQNAIDLEGISKFRESYACLSYVLSREGYHINNDLAGIDRPESVAKIYKELDTWLSE